MVGRVLGAVLGKRAEIIGSLALIGIGVLILYEHLNVWLDRAEKIPACTRQAGILESLVGRTGFEPVTNGLKVRCSTN